MLKTLQMTKVRRSMLVDLNTAGEISSFIIWQTQLQWYSTRVRQLTPVGLEPLSSWLGLGLGLEPSSLGLRLGPSWLALEPTCLVLIIT